MLVTDGGGTGRRSEGETRRDDRAATKRRQGRREGDRR